MFTDRCYHIIMKTQNCYKMCLLQMPKTNVRSKISKLMTASLFTSRFPFSKDDRSVSRYPVPDISSLPQDLRDRFGNSKFIPNAYHALSYRPLELRAFLFYSDVIMQDKGNLTKADKEMIALTVSVENKCMYCAITHSALHRMQAKNQILTEQLLVNWKNADLNSRQKAILEFAMEVCQSRSPSEKHYEKVYEHGLTQDDAWDIGTVAAFISFSNRLAHLTEMKPNPEFHFIGRVDPE